MGKIEELKAMVVSGRFHHATYRNMGTVWEGLWIYPKGDFRGYGAPEICFRKDDPELDQAYAYLREIGHGTSVGSFGNA